MNRIRPLNLNDLERIYTATAACATPHRTPDFEAIFANADGDAPITGTLMFIEEHNTGYNGVLERWHFTIPARDGTTITCWADLLPGNITTRDEQL